MNILRWVIIVLLFYLIFQVLKGLIGKDDDESGGKPAGPRNVNGTLTDDLVRDPYSGVFFPKSQGIPVNIDGRMLYFMNDENRNAYIKSGRSGDNGGYK